MPIIHFLNVREGDCSIIQHGSGRTTMIDVNNARASDAAAVETRCRLDSAEAIFSKSASGNFNQKDKPENPILYLKSRAIPGPFRFVLTHPDMDHMDGIKDLFDEFSPPNLWDTDHDCVKEGGWGRYRKEDWDFYCNLRRGTDVKRLAYYSGGAPQEYWKHDGLQVLSPTPPLVAHAIESGDYNDCSYVLLYSVHSNRRAIFAGDSHDRTWEHILKVHGDSVKDVDLLIAPHHGRHSDRDFAFLDVLRPKLTLFGNASSEHLAYEAWTQRGLAKITNNQAGNVVVDMSTGAVCVSNPDFARQQRGKVEWSSTYQAYYLNTIPAAREAVA